MLLHEAARALEAWREDNAWMDDVASGDIERMLFDLSKPIIMMLDWSAQHDPFNDDAERFALVIKDYCGDYYA